MQITPSCPSGYKLHTGQCKCVEDHPTPPPDCGGFCPVGMTCVGGSCVCINACGPQEIQTIGCECFGISGLNWRLNPQHLYAAIELCSKDNKLVIILISSFHYYSCFYWDDIVVYNLVTRSKGRDYVADVPHIIACMYVCTQGSYI